MAKKSSAPKPACKSFEDGTRDIRIVFELYRKYMAGPLDELGTAADRMRCFTDVDDPKSDKPEWLKQFGFSCNGAFKNARRMIFDSLVAALYRAATERGEQ